MKTRIFSFLLCPFLLLGCQSRKEGDLLSFAHRNGTYELTFQKENTAFCATVAIRENGKHITAQYTAPDTLAGTQIVKNHLQTSVVIDQKEFPCPKETLAPFAVFWAENPALLSAESQDGTRAVSLGFADGSTYTLFYEKGDVPVRIAGQGYDISLCEVAK